MEYLGTQSSTDSIATLENVNAKTSVTLNGTAVSNASIFAPTAQGATASTATSGIYTTRKEAQRLQSGTPTPSWVTTKQTTEFTTASDNTSRYATFSNALGTTDVCVSVYFYEGGTWKLILVDVSVTASTIQLTFDMARKSQTFKVVIIR